MITLPLGLSISGFIVAIATWLVYLRSIPRMEVPVNPIGSKIFLGVGICLGASAIILDGQGSETSGFFVFIPAILAVLLGFGFFWLFAQRKTPIGNLKTKVGDPLLPFKAMTAGGTEFHSDELAGKRILFKFFRGGW